MIGLSVGGAILVVALVVLATVLSRIFGDVGDGLGGDRLGLNAPDDRGGGRRRWWQRERQRRQTHCGDGLLPRGRGRRARAGGPGDRRQPVDGVADRHLHRRGAVPELQERRRADAAAAAAHHGRRGHHRPQQHRHRRRDPIGADVDAVVAGRHHGADAGHPAASPAPTPSRWTNASPTSNVLVWVSTLGQVNGQSRSDIAEITLKSAS